MAISSDYHSDCSRGAFCARPWYLQTARSQSLCAYGQSATPGALGCMVCCSAAPRMRPGCGPAHTPAGCCRPLRSLLPATAAACRLRQQRAGCAAAPAGLWERHQRRLHSRGRPQVLHWPCQDPSSNAASGRPMMPFLVETMHTPTCACMINDLQSPWTAHIQPPNPQPYPQPYTSLTHNK